MSDLTQTDEIALAKLEPILLRARVETPVVTSFGTIPERAVLLVRAEDRDGAVGWGEVFGNFPMHGAENRAHLIRDYIAPVALAETWHSPAAAFAAMTRKTHIMTLQSGEPGSFAQAIAGVDIARPVKPVRRSGGSLAANAMPFRPMPAASTPAASKTSSRANSGRDTTPSRLRSASVAKWTLPPLPRCAR